MKYRKLRIAWSVAWGVLALLLIVLWVRSYWWRDRIDLYFAPRTVISASTAFGDVFIAFDLHSYTRNSNYSYGYVPTDLYQEYVDAATEAHRSFAMSWKPIAY